MDKCEKYRELIRQVLTEYKSLENSSEAMESVLLLDDVQGQYLLLRCGWEDGDSPEATLRDRIERVAIHVRLKHDKIWIEEDCTEDGVATDFLQAGVPREDIVLAFHPEHLRQYTEFAIA